MSPYANVGKVCASGRREGRITCVLCSNCIQPQLVFLLKDRGVGLENWKEMVVTVGSTGTLQVPDGLLVKGGMLRVWGEWGEEVAPGKSRWGGQGQVPKEPQWPLSCEWRELFLGDPPSPGLLLNNSLWGPGSLWTWSSGEILNVCVPAEGRLSNLHHILKRNHELLE